MSFAISSLQQKMKFLLLLKSLTARDAMHLSLPLSFPLKKKVKLFLKIEGTASSMRMVA